MAYSKVEFFVEGEDNEIKFLNRLDDMCIYAQCFSESETWDDLYNVVQAVFDIARMLGYNI